MLNGWTQKKLWTIAYNELHKIEKTLQRKKDLTVKIHSEICVSS